MDLLFNVEDSEIESYVLREIYNNNVIDSFNIDLVSELNGYPEDYIVRSRELERKENNRINLFINNMIKNKLITKSPHRLTNAGLEKIESLRKKELENEECCCSCHDY